MLYVQTMCVGIYIYIYILLSLQYIGGDTSNSNNFNLYISLQPSKPFASPG